ncbi:lambda tail assembly I [Serratia sp. AS12]|uniref:tail assembly protein n=1 Tax=Serratia TaxID=613 RepID=UPI00020E9A10|nr:MULTISPECIES: tail assembly protein [Serratia]AEF46513.1 lambda tail assembly I [Serratia plymuthica AS9]AEF51465.1 lambda tail assembly I [Serratia sp. AS12]AEG29173.1 lambda tail assembly I [Serratia sp. AS13]UTN95223.1 tail assembly protein [Serratia plymuthica]
MALLIPEVKTIRLYGVLGATFGRVHRLAVDSPQEAIKALCTVIPGFQNFLLKSKEIGLTFAVFEGKNGLSRDDLIMPSNGRDIRIAPIIIGSKKAGVFQTILGAVMVVAGVLISVFSAGTMSAFGAQLAWAGGAMMLGGVIQMLSPMQGGLASRQDPDNKPSYAFGGPVNTIAQGNPVPILYGKRRIGGAIISAGIYAEDQQ